MMQARFPWRWMLLLAANAVMLGVLGFYRNSTAAPPQNQRHTFANSVEQRMEIIRQLRETNNLLRQQNELLKSGKLRVVAANEE